LAIEVVRIRSRLTEFAWWLLRLRRDFCRKNRKRTQCRVDCRTMAIDEHRLDGPDRSSFGGD